ncbi:MAG: hypothetical protein WCA77_05035 [Thermoplasmata archaeon]
MTLQRTRALAGRPIYRILAASIAIVYALVAMVVGGMLEILSPPSQLPPFALVLTSGTPSWDYPAVLIAAPSFVLALPFLPTIFMVLSSVGVGLGMSVAILLGVRLLGRQGGMAGRPAAVGTASGLTPVMIALVTLGACCSTTAAATAGIGVAAQASGTSIDNLLVNSWYVGLFQLVILYVALLAQEQLIQIYGFLFARQAKSAPVDPALLPLPPPMDRHFVTGAAFRVALIAGGVTWSLAALAAWTWSAAGSWSALMWASWVLQHGLVGITAVVAALAPRGVLRWLVAPQNRWPTRVLRGVLLASGASLVAWVPPPLATYGFFGVLNEILGSLGFPAAWGAVAPPFGGGVALLLRWGIQFLVLGAFAIALALRPQRAMGPILATLTHASAREPEASDVPLRAPVPVPSEVTIAMVPTGERP